jgi:hypothetical protein
MPLAFAAAMLVGMLAAAVPVRASETQWWIADGASDFNKSESRGLAVRPEGAIELGPRIGSTRIDSLATVWAAVPMKEGSVALAGDQGRILKWTEKGVRPWIKLPVGEVLCMVPDGDGVVVGTGPEGAIYRVGAKGDTTLLARTGERYVWGLAPAGRGAWYAATGTRGRLLRVEGGKAKIVLDTDESNLVSLIADGKGGAFTGGDSKGRIVHVSSDGKNRTVFDATEDEVRALVIGKDGALYAAALSAAAVSTPPSSSSSRDEDDSDERSERPEPVRSAPGGGRATVYRIVPDSVASTVWTSPQPFVYALQADGGNVLVATGNRAGVYALDPDQGATQWLAAPEGQVTALARDAQGRVYAATSNPAALWTLGPGKAERGELLSPTLDARRIARFGKLLWHGESGGGRVELFARSGNCDPADTTWSPWSGGAAGEDGVTISAPPARYLQWKLVLAGGNPRVESVEASWREQNLPPRIDDVSVAPQGLQFREGDLVPRSEPVTQQLPSGQRVEYSLNVTPAPTPLRELPTWARGLRTLQWRGVDPNGDPLRYTIEVRAEGREAWILLAHDEDTPTYTIDTSALPDGRYRARVTATDKLGNAVGEERTAVGTSPPFTVDNSPPVVTSLDARGEGEGLRVEAKAEDSESTLSRIEVSVDDGEWRTVTPEGGLADDRRVTARATFHDVKPGEHTVSVRAIDRAGNSSTRAQRVTIAAPRK